ncbi:MAG TPA: ATP-binding protein [Gemmatimonadaceae bacterium]|nr:ATP-binding protein [Gemmatimonadaceae bacterium]
MRRLGSLGSTVTRIVIVAQLGCVVIGTALLLRLARQVRGAVVVELFSLAAVAGVVTLVGWWLLSRENRAAAELARNVDHERLLKAKLEEAIASRTSELEDARRVLQRMWWLGQQITLELNPGRVIERFLEAVADIAQAEGSLVALIGDDGAVHIAEAIGLAESLSGYKVAMAGSAMGLVIRDGVTWSTDRLANHASEIDPGVFERIGGQVGGIAMVPISRRGERVGAVTVVTKTARRFTAAEIERIEAMGDLLSLSLENAELVETLRSAELRFRTLFRAAPDAVFTVLSDGRIREANDAVAELTGIDPVLVVGRSVTDLVAEGDREKLLVALDATITGSPARIELSFMCDTPGRATPMRRVVAVAMSRLPESDPPSVLLVGRDTTSEHDMRMRLMVSDRLAAVGELVAGVAHEVNNPLSSISAFAQILLRDGDLTPMQYDSIEVIRSETMRASQVVKDLLAFARRSEPMRSPVDVNSVVQGTLRLRGYQLTSTKVAVETALAAELPSVIGDARQLQQVCLNLVTNAAQAMAPQGGGKLFITTSADGPDVVIEVRDTGPGIPDSVRPHIFEPFFTTKDEGEGTGLGLSVSYGIVTSHGGRIEVASTSAAGTTFRVALPAHDDELADAAGAPAAAEYDALQVPVS